MGSILENRGEMTKRSDRKCWLMHIRGNVFVGSSVQEGSVIMESSVYIGSSVCRGSNMDLHGDQCVTKGQSVEGE